MDKPLKKNQRFELDTKLREIFNAKCHDIGSGFLKEMEPIRTKLAIKFYMVPQLPYKERCTGNSLCFYYKTHEDLPYLEDYLRFPYSTYRTLEPNEDSKALMFTKASKRRITALARACINNPHGRMDEKKEYKVIAGLITTKTDLKLFKKIKDAEGQLRADVKTLQSDCDDFYAKAVLAGTGLDLVKALDKFAGKG